jgi:hypothetical protein
MFTWEGLLMGLIMLGLPIITTYDGKGCERSLFFLG